MFYKKKGLPEEGEYVICTVKKILYHSVFASLDEYNHKDGMIHISEVSPGRIRNIRDYVKEGKKLICKILRVRLDRGHIDLSLRRVSIAMRKKKNTEIKQEQKSEKIMDRLAKKLNISLELLYKDFGNKVWEEYEGLYPFFQDVMSGDATLDKMVPQKYIPQLSELIKENIKPPTIKIERVLELKSESSEGIEIIKESLKKSISLAQEKNYNLDVCYISAPKYSFKISSSDYKSAEKAMEEVTTKAINFINSKEGYGEIKK